MKKFGKILGICIAVLCLSMVLVACNVPAPKAITVKTNPTQTEYFVGDKINVGGGVLEVTYDDDSKEEIGLGAASLSTVDMSTAGEKTVTATYKELTTTFTIKVKDAVATTLEVKTFFQNLEVFTSTSLTSLKGYLAVIATFDDGTSEFLSASDYTISSEDVVDDKWTTVGSKTATVAYGNASTTFTVDVQAVVSIGFEVEFNQGDLKLYITDDLTVSPESTTQTSIKERLTVTELFNDGSEVIRTGYNIFAGMFEQRFTSFGEVEMMVAIQPVNPKFTVTVLDDPLTSIAVVSSVTEIDSSTTLDSLKSKFTVTGTYTHAGEKVIDKSDVTLSLASGETTLAVGDNVVTVTVGKTTTTVTIKGLKVVKKIEAVYTQGDQVVKVKDDASVIKPNLVVNAVYSDGTKVAVNNDNVTVKAYTIDWMGAVYTDTFLSANEKHNVEVRATVDGVVLTATKVIVNVVA